MSNFEISREDNKEITVLKLHGYLDAHTAREFEQSLANVIKEQRFKIVVSLENLKYISSAGLGVFMGFIEEVRKKGGDIKIAQPSPKVYKVFDLLGFPNLYEFYDQLETALKAFEKTQQPGK
ncbi:MAG: anti-sigma factor antagonist [Calditrichaeota bacterium]|nr:MAG: anti-sigma factor antagonist [Calditrichota bacterium]